MKTSVLKAASWMLVSWLILVVQQYSVHANAADTLLRQVSTAIASANSLEYTSRIQMAGAAGTAQTFFVHAKLEKPASAWVSFSNKSMDDTNAMKLASNHTAVYEYDPTARVFAVSPAVLSGLAIKHDFIHAAKVIAHAQEFLATDRKPLVGFLTQENADPLTLARRAADVPGTQLIVSSAVAGDGIVSLHKLWIGNSDSLPRKYTVSILQNGVESIVYQEDFQKYSLDVHFTEDDFNVAIPPDADPWKESQVQTASAAVAVPVKLAGYFNCQGVVSDDEVFQGGLDGIGHAISAQQIVPALTCFGVPWVLGKVGGNDVVACRGQTIALPRGNYSSLDLLAVDVGENPNAIPFIVQYSDAPSREIDQQISDWKVPHNLPGETIAARMAHRDVSGGFRDVSGMYYVYAYKFALDRDKEVQALTLPQSWGNMNGTVLIAATLEP